MPGMRDHDGRNTQKLGQRQDGLETKPKRYSEWGGRQFDECPEKRSRRRWIHVRHGKNLQMPPARSMHSACGTARRRRGTLSELAGKSAEPRTADRPQPAGRARRPYAKRCAKILGDAALMHAARCTSSAMSSIIYRRPSGRGPVPPAPPRASAAWRFHGGRRSHPRFG